MKAKTPPKSRQPWFYPRCAHRAAVHSDLPKPAETSSGSGTVSHPDSYNAPSHMGGQFEEAGYSAGKGAFGFTQDRV